MRPIGLLTVGLLLIVPLSPQAQEKPPANPAKELYARDNLVAWCIVPFDAKKRGPEERVAMLKRLGFRRYAYDWRAEHLPTFDRELQLLKENAITLEAVWFPANLNDDARTILGLLRKHQIKTQLWVTMSDPAPGAKEQAEKIAAGAKILKPIAEEAARLGCWVGLYNHGNWFGEPENQLALLDELKLSNVGLVYNLHHGHDHLDRFPALMKKMLPHLYAVNLNGMVIKGDQVGKKILALGEGDQDLALLRAIRESGYRGPIGILGHTQDDVEHRLLDNLDGLDWLVPQLDGKAPGLKPKYRTSPIKGSKPRSEPALPKISFEARKGRIEIRVGDQPLATYVYQDDTLARPCFLHARAPGGIQVTRNHPPQDADRKDHTGWHPGLWLAFDDINGHDYWRFKARVVHDGFVTEPTGGPGRGSFAVRNRYLTTDGKATVCVETCRYTFIVRPSGYLLLWESSFTSDRDFTFGGHEEMGLGVRVATPLAVVSKKGGRMLDSAGRRDEKGVWGKQADWCDYSGPVDGKWVGVTLMPDPANSRRSWFHARDYGVLVANSFGPRARGEQAKGPDVVKGGETFRLRFGILLHADAGGKEPDLSAAYKDFVEQLNAKRE